MVAGLIAYDDEIMFRMHSYGFFNFAPLRYVQGNVSTLCAFVHDRHIFSIGLDDMLSHIMGEK